MKLNGHESSVLAYLAQRPEYFDKLTLSDLGPDAMAIARYLAAKDLHPTPDVKATGDAIWQWAKERRERQEKMK
jgi:hypothetical protein